MPWCEECNRYLAADSLGAGGECPRCGRAAPNPGAGAEAEEPSAPWHFKLLVVATVAYLAFRAYQGLAWLAGRL